MMKDDDVKLRKCKIQNTYSLLRLKIRLVNGFSEILVGRTELHHSEYALRQRDLLVI